MQYKKTPALLLIFNVTSQLPISFMDKITQIFTNVCKELNGHMLHEENNSYFNNYEEYIVSIPCSAQTATITFHLQRMPERGRSSHLVHFTRFCLPVHNPKNIIISLHKRSLPGRLLSGGERFRLKQKPAGIATTFFRQKAVQQQLTAFESFYIEVVPATPAHGQTHWLAIHLNYVVTNPIIIKNTLALGKAIVEAIFEMKTT